MSAVFSVADALSFFLQKKHVRQSLYRF